MVGVKKARPCTVMLLSKKIKPMVNVVGARMPCLMARVFSLSNTSVAPTCSRLIRVMARSFSSCDNHLAVSIRSVIKKYEAMPIMVVMIPSIKKICSHACTEPMPLIFRIPEASNPPKAPAKGAHTIGQYDERQVRQHALTDIPIYIAIRKANSSLVYHRDR